MNVADTAIARVNNAAERLVMANKPANKPPSYGQPQRDAVNSIVDGIAQDIAGKIEALRRRLDDIQQQVLEGAVNSKHSLNEQIAVCCRVNDELNHMNDVIEEIAGRLSHERST